MSFETISGIVSNINQMSSTYGSVNNGKGHVNTKNWITFRINNRPAIYSGYSSIGNGDMVTAVGENCGELNVVALHNHTTHMVYTKNTSQYNIYIALCILMGLPGVYVFITPFISQGPLLGQIILCIIGGVWALPWFGGAWWFYMKQQKWVKCNQIISNGSS
ncbi:MAG: hypothetical protein Q7T80_00990 [Methanoregula sp.]|nr:hypothetical protein [Methanoregula sp.]